MDYYDIERHILRLLGIKDSNVYQVVIKLRAGHLPVVRVSKYILDGDSSGEKSPERMTERYTLVENDYLEYLQSVADGEEVDPVD